MNPESDDRPNMADRFVENISRPENLARIIRWAWLISLLMLVMGYIIIFTKVKQYINW